MAIDTRDWYVDRLRKLSGYVERSAFRSSGSERRSFERRKAAGALLLKCAALVAVPIAALALVAQFLR